MTDDPHLEASLHVATPFVRYDPQTGRIDTFGEQPLAGTQREQLTPPDWTRMRALLGVGRPETHYVERDAEGVPRIIERPAFQPVFRPTKVRVNTEAVLANLPACTIRFAGPENGTHEHAGGDLVVGFVSPGTYVIDAEPFPFQRLSRTLEVTA